MRLINKQGSSRSVLLCLMLGGLSLAQLRVKQGSSKSVLLSLVGREVFSHQRRLPWRQLKQGSQPQPLSQLW